MSCTFESETLFIDSATGLADKLIKIDAIISSLYDLAIASVAKPTADLSEYMLDDGQTKIRTVYRSLSEIQKAILDYETIR